MATTAQKHNVGENVTYSVQGDTLHVEINLKHRGGPSASGKTIRVATTNGNAKVDGSDVVIGVNAYVKNPDFQG